MTMGTSNPAVFCGGDLADTAETTVEAVADGKIAAWSMHRYFSIHELSDTAKMFIDSYGPQFQVPSVPSPKRSWSWANAAQVPHSNWWGWHQCGALWPQVSQPLRPGLSSSGHNLANDQEGIRGRMGIRSHQDLQPRQGYRRQRGSQVIFFKVLHFRLQMLELATLSVSVVSVGRKSILDYINYKLSCQSSINS